MGRDNGGIKKVFVFFGVDLERYPGCVRDALILQERKGGWSEELRTQTKDRGRYLQRHKDLNEIS